MCLDCFSSSLTRRDALRLGALFTATGAAPLLRAASARAAEPDQPVRIGYLPITDAAPLLIAHANGLFEARGLRVETPTMLRSWAQLVEAFLSGQVNVVHLLSPMTIWARYASHAPIKVVAWNHVDGSALTVAPDIKDVAGLGGKVVAVPFWYSIHNVVLQTMLRAKGLTPVTGAAAPAMGEVRLVVMAPSDMMPALAAGRIAGYVVAEPFDAAAEARGIGHVLRFTGDVWRAHACCVVAMQEHDLQQRPEWSGKVVDANVAAQLWIRGNRARTASLLSRQDPHHYTPHDDTLLARVLAPPADAQAAYVASGTIRHPDWHQPRIDFQPYPYPSYTEELVRQLKTTRMGTESGFLAGLDPASVARDLVEVGPVRRAIESQGGLAAFGLPGQYARQEIIAA